MQCQGAVPPKLQDQPHFNTRYPDVLPLDPGRLQLSVTFRSFADVILCQLDNHLLKPGRQAGKHLYQTSAFHDRKVPSSEYFQTTHCDCRLPAPHPLKLRSPLVLMMGLLHMLNLGISRSISLL